MDYSGEYIGNSAEERRQVEHVNIVTCGGNRPRSMCVNVVCHVEHGLTPSAVVLAVKTKAGTELVEQDSVNSWTLIPLLL